MCLRQNSCVTDDLKKKKKNWKNTFELIFAGKKSYKKGRVRKSGVQLN